MSLAGYVVLSLWFPLRPYFNHSPSPDIRSLAPSLGEAALYGLLLVMLYGLLWLAYKFVRNRQNGLSITTILLTAALFCIPLILTFPINATDIYLYFVFGRISSVHGQNPYTVTVTELGDEPYGSLAGEWMGQTTPYGPLWELTASAVTSITPDNLWLGLLLFKGLAALLFLIVGGLIWLALSDVSPSRRSALTLLWAWNPSLLLIFAVDGHNDALMLLWLLLGWWLMVRGRLEWGMIFMLLAPLTKLIGIIPLPFFFIASWRQLPGIRARVRFLVATLVASLVLLTLTFLPFGSPLSLIQRLINEAGSGGGFSPLTLIILQMRSLGLNPSISTATSVGILLLFLLVVWLLWQTWRGRSPLRAAADIFAGYIVQAFRFRIWYAAWPFPWLLLDRGQNNEDDISSRARLAAGMSFLITSQFSVLIYGQIRTELLGSSQLGAHWLGVFFTFLVPILLGLAVAAYNVSSRERQKEKSG